MGGDDQEDPFMKVINERLGELDAKEKVGFVKLSIRIAHIAGSTITLFLLASTFVSPIIAMLLGVFLIPGLLGLSDRISKMRALLRDLK